jgi:hypothetical protein
MRLTGKTAISARTEARFQVAAKLGVAAGIAVTALAALIAAAPAQAAAPAKAVPPEVWRLAYSTHGGPSRVFDAIVAPAKNDAWAVADTNTPNTTVTAQFAHWNGKTWSNVTVKAAAGIDFDGAYYSGYDTAYSTSPGNVWFFGLNQKTQRREALVYNGRAWHTQPLPPNFGVPLAVLGPKDMWGQTQASLDGGVGDSTVLIRWNGRTWADVTIQGSEPTASSAGAHAWIMTIDATPVDAPGHVPTGSPIVYRITGASVAKVGAPPGATITEDESGIAAAPDGRLWILGCCATGADDLVYSGSGSKWAVSSARNDLGTVVGAFSYDGKNGFWDGPYGHWTGSKLINTNNEAKPIANTYWSDDIAAPIPGTNSVWAAGYVLRTAKGTASNAVIAVYGPLP